MRNVFLLPVVCLAFAGIAEVRAADVSVDAYGDLRLVFPGDERSWLDGGLGKLRYGSDQPDPNFRFAEAVAQGTLALSDDFHVVAVARVEPKDRTGIDALEAYASWRPHIDDWSFNVKGGAFFPPFSLENTDLGWTSPYTLTPSAINSWIGDELRTIGGEARVEHHTDFGNFAVTGAAFCCNDPGGVLIADRGWSLDDRPTGLFEEVRLPDATLHYFDEDAPDRTSLFKNIESRIGWYGGLEWSYPGFGKLAAYRYDNNADPSASAEDYHAWHTTFWSAGWSDHFGPVTILAQGMTGRTTIAVPDDEDDGDDDAARIRARAVTTDEDDDDSDNENYVTKFSSAYLLAAYDLNAWRFAGRAEVFHTKSGFELLSENGNALTGAVTWTPRDWLRVTSEVIYLNSKREERILEDSAPGQLETQVQISTRFFL